MSGLRTFPGRGRILVKLCGLRTPADVDAAVAAGADAVGLVLCASPRRVTRAEAAALLERVPAGVLRVAVMGSPTAALLARARALAFDAVQCELGDAPEPRLPDARFLLPGFRDAHDVEARIARRRRSRRVTAASHPLVDAVLLDGPGGGGRGSSPDAARARRLAAAGPLVLAGGLNPETVAARVAAVGPLAVDVSSGIEGVRGRKDPARMRAFVAAARDAAPARPTDPHAVSPLREVAP